MRAKETACIVVSFIIVAGAFAHDRALASAQNVLNVLGPTGYLPLDGQKITEFRNALCEDAQQTLERAPPFTREMQEKLKRMRAALPPLGTDGFGKGVAAMSRSKEVALETINTVANAVILECTKASNSDLRFWINVATALSDETFDQVVTNLQNDGVDLRSTYDNTTAMFVARQIMLEVILRRIVKPQINSSSP
jgi:hypothetical protein